MKNELARENEQKAKEKKGDWKRREGKNWNGVVGRCLNELLMRKQDSGKNMSIVSSFFVLFFLPKCNFCQLYFVLFLFFLFFFFLLRLLQLLHLISTTSAFMSCTFVSFLFFFFLLFSSYLSSFSFSSSIPSISFIFSTFSDSYITISQLRNNLDWTKSKKCQNFVTQFLRRASKILIVSLQTCIFHIEMSC